MNGDHVERTRIDFRSSCSLQLFESSQLSFLSRREVTPFLEVLFLLTANPVRREGHFIADVSTALQVNCCSLSWEGFPGGSAVKNPPANAGDVGSIPGLGRPLEKETATHSSILVWRIQRTEEPGRLQSMGSQKSRAQVSNSTTCKTAWPRVSTEGFPGGSDD